MPIAPQKPHFTLGSPSGRSFIQMRVSKRSLLNISSGLVAIAVFAFIATWGVKKLVAKPDGSIGTVYDLPSGTWGELNAQPVLIEAPNSLLSANFRLGDGRWYFAANSGTKVDTLLRAAGLTPAQTALLLPALQPVTGRSGLMAVTPPPQLIRELTPEVRSALYDKLALIPENFAQVEPFRITEIHLDDWLDSETLPPELIAQVNRLMWRRGSSLLFSDYNTLADSLDSPAVKLELLRQLTRKASLVVKLRVPDSGDVEPLVAYWGTGGRAEKVRPILSSLARSGGGELDISNLLPIFARQRLYRFPDTLPGTDLGPGCHWAAFNFFTQGAPDDTLHAPEGVEKVLSDKFVPATDEPHFGDIILLTLPDGSSIHSGVYIADGIVYTKNGPSLATPYVFSTMQDMLAFYPSSENVRLTYYRRAGT